MTESVQFFVEIFGRICSTLIATYIIRKIDKFLTQK